MKFYFQKNTEIYFLAIGGDFYSSQKTGKARKEGKNVLKNSFPPPKEIPKDEVPMKVKKKFEAKIKTFRTPYEYVAESFETDLIEIKEDIKIPQKKGSVILEKGDKIRVLEDSNFVRPKYQKEFSDLFNKLVPSMGTSPTVAGEIIRAVNWIEGKVNRSGEDNFKDWAPFLYLWDMTSFYDLPHIKKALMGSSRDPNQYVANLVDASYLDVSSNKEIHQKEADDMYDGYPHSV